MKKYISWLLLPFLFLLSCQKEESILVETGSLVVYASQNHDVSVQTKASVADMPISIAICEASSGDTVEFFESYEELGTNKVDLAVGEYYIKASTLPGTEALFDNPFYYGVDTVQIKPGYIVEAEVECVLANTKVTVAYSDRMKEFFSSYKTTVRNSSGSLMFVENEMRAGYYVPEKLYVQLDLVNTDGTPYRMLKELPNVKAREHYSLAFSVGEVTDSPAAGADFEITVDESTDTILCNFKVPIFTDDYGRNLPEILSSSSSLNIKHKNVAPSATLTSSITGKHGISVLALKLVSPYFNIEKGLPKYIDLKSADASMKERLNSVGITGISNLGTDTVKIDFNSLLVGLPLGADGKATTHAIGLLVRDSLGQQVEDTIVVNVRPDISIEVTMNQWSRFVYMNAVLSTDQGVIIKYKVKGEPTWIELPMADSKIMQRADGSFSLINDEKIVGLSASTTYEYEIVAGMDDVNGEFVTSDETPLVDGSFEDWGSINGQTYWGSGNNDFATLAATSTGRTGSLGGTQAAQLHSQYAVIKFAAGNIFTGAFNIAGLSDGELNLGRSYTSRPTSLKGYYKYRPKDVTHTQDASRIAIDVKDTCIIYIALTTSTKYVHSAKPETFFKKDDPSVIAYAELTKEETCETAGDGFHEFNLPLVYRDLVTLPSYIIIVCTSSKYGDYFSGAVDSKLWLDDFVLDFSGDPLTE